MRELVRCSEGNPTSSSSSSGIFLSPTLFPSSIVTTSMVSRLILSGAAEWPSVASGDVGSSSMAGREDEEEVGECSSASQSSWSFGLRIGEISGGDAQLRTLGLALGLEVFLVSCWWSWWGEQLRIGEHPSTNGLSLVRATSAPSGPPCGVKLLCCFCSPEKIQIREIKSTWTDTRSYSLDFFFVRFFSNSGFYFDSDPKWRGQTEGGKTCSKGTEDGGPSLCNHLAKQRSTVESRLSTWVYGSPRHVNKDRRNSRRGVASRRWPIRKQRAADAAEATVSEAALLDGTRRELALQFRHLKWAFV